MTTFYSQPQDSSSARPELPPLMRSPQRISITINWDLHRRLIERSGLEGRSLSNLAAFLLEDALGKLAD